LSAAGRKTETNVTQKKQVTRGIISTAYLLKLLKSSNYMFYLNVSGGRGGRRVYSSCNFHINQKCGFQIKIILPSMS